MVSGISGVSVFDALLNHNMLDRTDTAEDGVHLYYVGAVFFLLPE